MMLDVLKKVGLEIGRMAIAEILRRIADKAAAIPDVSVSTEDDKVVLSGKNLRARAVAEPELRNPSK